MLPQMATSSVKNYLQSCIHFATLVWHETDIVSVNPFSAPLLCNDIHSNFPHTYPYVIMTCSFNSDSLCIFMWSKFSK